MRYYISDLHFCHSNMNQHMDMRGFASGEEMNDYMVTQWNSRVRKKDEVDEKRRTKLNCEEIKKLKNG